MALCGEGTNRSNLLPFRFNYFEHRCRRFVNILKKFLSYLVWLYLGVENPVFGVPHIGLGLGINPAVPFQSADTFSATHCLNNTDWTYVSKPNFACVGMLGVELE